MSGARQRHIASGVERSLRRRFGHVRRGSGRRLVLPIGYSSSCSRDAVQEPRRLRDVRRTQYCGRCQIENRPEGTVEAQVPHLGNIYFAQRDWDGALYQLQRCALRRTRRARWRYYNKSLAARREFLAVPDRGRRMARARGDVRLPIGQAHEGGNRVGPSARLARHRDRSSSSTRRGPEPSRRPVYQAALSSTTGTFDVDDRFGVAEASPSPKSFRSDLPRALACGSASSRRCWKCGERVLRTHAQIGTGRKGLKHQCLPICSS